MASIEILNNNEINVNVNDNDSWSLNVNNSNFMLKKYNGIGPSTVELKTFSNVGELFGEIELYVNGKLCNNYDLKQIDNVESDFFYIIPNVINLNGKGDARNVIVYTNDSQWEYEELNNNNRIIVFKENNNLIITSNIDEIFYDLRIKIYSNNLDAKPYDYVTVNQTFKSYDDNDNVDLFKVNPTYLLFTKQNEVKNVTVTTSCKDGYEISELSSPFSYTDNGKGKISVKYIGDGSASASTSFNISSCGSSEKIDVKYDNTFNTKNYLYIISSDTQYSIVSTSLVSSGENDYLGILEYELSSTSKVMVYSKPNQIVSSISNLDGNNTCKLRVQFDNTEDFQGQIKLRNNDGIFAYINISISGYGDAKGIVFEFNDTNTNTKVLESNENGEYIVTINSYYNKNKTPLNFNIYTNDFKLKDSSNLKPFKPSSSSTTLTFISNSNIKGTKTIQLEEVETFGRLYIKINIDYGNAYYNFYFVDENGEEYNSWKLIYDYKGVLLEDETPMYDKILSLSGSSLNDINKEVSFTPESYSKIDLGIVDDFTKNENYYSSFTFTQNGSNNKLTLYVTQINNEKCNVDINYINATIEISGDTTVDKCFDKTPSFNVLLSDVSMLTEDCEYVISSFTLTQGTDFDVTFEPNDSNKTNSTREIEVSLKGKGVYSDISSSFTITQDAGPCFEPYYEFCIRTGETFTTCLTSETVSHNTSSDLYNIRIRSRYYTSEETYDVIDFTLSTNDSWIHINGNSYTVDLNNTTSDRKGTITYTQNNTNKKVYLYINQNASIPQEKICNVPSGSFDESDGFKISFVSAVTSNVDVKVELKNTDCAIVDTIEVMVNRGQQVFLIKNISEVIGQAAQYFKIIDVNPLSDTTFIYWGGDCNYDNSGDCVNKTKITVTFSGTITRKMLNGNSGNYGCDRDDNNKYELYLPDSIIMNYNINYKIEGITTIPSELFIIVESKKYHQGHEDTGVTSFNPTSLSGTILRLNSCDTRVSDEICYKVEQPCSPTSWRAYLTDYSKYDLEIIDNVIKTLDGCDDITISCNPKIAYTSGNSVDTIVTLDNGRYWEVDTGYGISSGETGGIFSTSHIGKYTIYPLGCKNTNCEFEIKPYPKVTSISVTNNLLGDIAVNFDNYVTYLGPGKNSGALNINAYGSFNLDITILNGSVSSNDELCSSCTISFHVEGENIEWYGLNENCGTWSEINPDDFWFIPSCNYGEINGHMYFKNGNEDITINISGGNT